MSYPFSCVQFRSKVAQVLPQKFTVAYCGLLTMRRWPTCAPLHSPSAWALECADPSDVGMLTSLGKPWWCQGQTYNLRHKKSFTGGYGSIPIDTFLVGWTSINPSYFDVHQGYKVLTHCQIIHRSSLAIRIGGMLKTHHSNKANQCAADDGGSCLPFFNFMTETWQQII